MTLQIFDYDIHDPCGRLLIPVLIQEICSLKKDLGDTRHATTQTHVPPAERQFRKLLD